jgi:sigma-B regulation protein RsbU (phosphoserine phosphatase)
MPVSESPHSLPTVLLAPVEGSPVGDRLRQASDRAAFLSRVARTLSGALHTTRAVDLVLELLAGPAVDWAQVTLTEGRGHVFRCRDARGRTEAATIATVELDPGSSLLRVLGTGSSDLLLVAAAGDGLDEDVDDRTLASAVPAAAPRALLRALRPMDLLTLPLTARGTTFGALTVARGGGAGFDEAGVGFLEDFARQVSAVLDTTRVLADSRRVAAVLAQDLNPPSLPALSGVELASYYRVALEQDALGGDFYDVHGSDDEWTAVMGDVCGKGVEAAVLTGKVRQSVRTAALIDRDPAATLALVNRVLLVDGADVFVTAVCVRGRRRADGLRLDVAVAGHPAPLVVRRDGSVEEVPVAGTVLGLLDGTSYTSVPVELAPGETCLLFTDGVTEAPGHRSRFGDERLRRVLESAGCCDVRAQVESVAVAVSHHLLDRPHDDIAVLGIQAVAS